ncbi:hypothetical protein DFH94DRAFT_848056 [Russula ochroleuca]|uniref:Uncharacterized protein n=1 Tax=Russula ochroleuca TaxID=152965 RepID=A0A9P5MQB3_9AGAM|nr:hypothetical protein DFH94DRAFT_848056 [Russula ochroleuca]
MSPESLMLLLGRFACGVSNEISAQGNKPRSKANNVPSTRRYQDELFGTSDLVNLSFGYRMPRHHRDGRQHYKTCAACCGQADVLCRPDYRNPKVKNPASMQGTSIVANVNRIFAGGGTAKRLLGVDTRFGNYCDSHTGINGTSL